jgi:hypothetical protein
VKIPEIRAAPFCRPVEICLAAALSDDWVKAARKIAPLVSTSSFLLFIPPVLSVYLASPDAPETIAPAQEVPVNGEEENLPVNREEDPADEMPPSCGTAASQASPDEMRINEQRPPVSRCGARFGVG